MPEKIPKKPLKKRGEPPRKVHIHATISAVVTWLDAHGSILQSRRGRPAGGMDPIIPALQQHFNVSRRTAQRQLKAWANRRAITDAQMIGVPESTARMIRAMAGNYHAPTQVSQPTAAVHDRGPRPMPPQTARHILIAAVEACAPDTLDLIAQRIAARRARTPKNSSPARLNQGNSLLRDLAELIDAVLADEGLSSPRRDLQLVRDQLPT
jgi:hypothetical protein